MSKNGLKRREFIASASVAALLHSSPTQLAAREACRCELLNLHPGRFMAGLAFRVGRAVLVDLVSDAIVSDFRRTGKLRFGRIGFGQLGGWHPDNYRVSLAAIELSEIRTTMNERIALSLENASNDTIARLKTIRGYLHKERLEVAFWSVNQEASRRVERDEPFDNLFSIEWFANAQDDQLRHFHKLIDETGVTVFQELGMV
ncbi:hypothetical protein Sulfitobl28_36330 (plasmid) [Sulfitobacter pontiacus]|nr:hypothetical protein Sulfitobl28_36100 [Sulfitobacter pontiacus]BDY17661.1 hypothetical protein Sulfitobl28_36330 [Sulfitobacter pontiacus]